MFCLTFAAEARRMVDPAKTPAKPAAQLRKEQLMAKKASLEAKDAKKGGVRPPAPMLILKNSLKYFAGY